MITKRGMKTETLSLRLDPKIKFSLEFASRINGQKLTTIVERAVQSWCDRLTVGDQKYNWRAFWDHDEGIRTLKLLACEGYPATSDEDELRGFTKSHWGFFYTSRDATTPHRTFVEILWPKIEVYRRLWLEQRDHDYWIAGKAMAADLSTAKLKPPLWPPPSPKSGCGAIDT
jgi:hypothetical protein